MRGVIIPPSAMLIIYSFVAEKSVGQMFIAGIIPGIFLAFAFIVAIYVMGRFTPKFVGGCPTSEFERMSLKEMSSKTVPIVSLIVIVLGGIYTGWLTPVEAGAAGAVVALAFVLIRRRISFQSFWQALLETGHITASILFLTTAASIYSRMLGIAKLPNQ